MLRYADLVDLIVIIFGSVKTQITVFYIIAKYYNSNKYLYEIH